MECKLQVVEGERAAVALPEHVQLSLAGIAGQAKEGVLALAVGTSLAVQHKTLGWEPPRIVGPKGRHDRDRIAKRLGHTKGEVTLGGRRVPVCCPRVRSAADARRSGVTATRSSPPGILLRQVMLERVGRSAALRPSWAATAPLSSV